MKDHIETLEGTPIRVHLSATKHHSYRTPKQGSTLFRKLESDIEIDLVDAPFTALLFEHLRQTHDFDGFKQWINEVLQKRESQRAIVSTQLEELHVQQEAILGERLAIRAYINQQVKAALAEDESIDMEALKAHFEKQVSKDLERLKDRSAKLDKREKELLEKLPSNEVQKEERAARIFADFQTELERLAQNWHKKSPRAKKDFVNLLVTKAVLSVVATHWIKLTVIWKYPAWTTETLYIYRRRGGINEWTENELDLVRLHYPDKQKQELLPLLPDKSWSAIEMQAHKMEVKHTKQPNPLNFDGTTTWTDYEFCQQIGVPWETKETLYRPEGSNSKFVALSTLVI